jgi:hypothetical protein
MTSIIGVTFGVDATPPPLLDDIAIVNYLLNGECRSGVDRAGSATRVSKEVFLGG